MWGRERERERGEVGGEGWADRAGDGRRHGGFTLWAALHPILAALVLSVMMTLLGLVKMTLPVVTSGRSVRSWHLSGWRVLIASGAMELVFLVMFTGLTLTVARARRRSGVALTAEGLDLPFEEDRDAAARRPPALLVLRPSMRTVMGLTTMLPLLLGALALVAGVVKVDTGHGGVVPWFVLGLLSLAIGIWTSTGHRRQRIVVDSDDVYVYTFTGRYHRAERSRIAMLRRTQTEPTLADADGTRLVRLPYLTGAQRGELGRVLEVPVVERDREGERERDQRSGGRA